jgi:hypothetical protein
MIDRIDNIEDLLMYFHGKTIDNCRFTVSGLEIDGVFHLGIAMCSDKDRFQRKLGRVISSNRALSYRYVRGKMAIDTTVMQIFTFKDRCVSFCKCTKDELMELFALKK